MTDLAKEKHEYPLLPLKNVVIFPRTIVTLLVGRRRSIQAVDRALERDHRMVVFTQRDVDIEDPRPDDLFTVGTLVEVMQVQRQGDGNIQVVVEGLRRVLADEFVENNRFYAVKIGDLHEKAAISPQVKVLMRHTSELFEQYSQLNKHIPAEAIDSVQNVNHPGYLADLIAGHVIADANERQKILETLDQAQRLEKVSVFLANELELLELEQEIRNKVRQQIDKSHREYYLREQLKAIHDELGGEHGNEIAELHAKIDEKGLPEDISDRMHKEVSRLERMPTVSPESTVVRNYIDWVLGLPWQERSEDILDIDMAEEILDEDHYGLREVKERIIEYLAVKQLTHDTPAEGRGAILCLVGPPGVGKTSLGQSIARAMGRKFIRISLGGVRDEAEIRGHRRTYIGALPGRVIHAMKNVGTRNPVIMLDEIDKMTADYRGDPASALLEVLDPEQNNTYTDHYLDFPYDLSEVFFITTANVLYTISKPLRDRMEIIEIEGYTEDEKVQIAKRYLLPKQVAGHGLAADAVDISDKVLRLIISDYTREAGVRDLERKLAMVCRKVARRVVKGKSTKVRITAATLEEYLGVRRFGHELISTEGQVGVAHGLAWTEHGGEILPVEVATMPGRGALTITGRLGDVMQESAKAALSYARSRARQLKIDLDFQDKTDLHIHFPEGAVPKDGPSAGITIATALISALTQRPVRGDLAMTGEITLRGRVLPIGGLKEKVLAAHRAGMKTVLAPEENRRDLRNIPKNVLKDMEIIWVESMDQVINHAFALDEPVSEESHASDMEAAVPGHEMSAEQSISAAGSDFARLESLS